jgi:hypothetical protein
MAAQTMVCPECGVCHAGHPDLVLYEEWCSQPELVPAEDD